MIANAPPSAKRDQTRARLIDGARQAFGASGYHDARISDITGAAGLSHGSFYRYFQSKEEILVEAAGGPDGEWNIYSLELLDPGADSCGTSMRHQVLESNRRYLAAYRDRAEIMRVIEEVTRCDESVRSIWTAHHRRGVDRMERTISLLRARHLVDRRLDPRITAAALTALVSRFAEMCFGQERLRCTFGDAVEQLTDLCVNVLALDITTGTGA